jgi:hypothetical protein
MQITIVSRLMNRVDTSTDVKKRERLKELAGERVRGEDTGRTR